MGRDKAKTKASIRAKAKGKTKGNTKGRTKGKAMGKTKAGHSAEAAGRLWRPVLSSVANAARKPKR
jgi:hypothetical protein